MIRTFQDLQEKALFLAHNIDDINKLHQLDFKENGFTFSIEVLNYFTQHCSPHVNTSQFLKVRTFSANPPLRNESIISALEKIYSSIFANQYPKPNLRKAIGNQLSLIPKPPNLPFFPHLVNTPRTPHPNSYQAPVRYLRQTSLDFRKVTPLPSAGSSNSFSSIRYYSLPPLFYSSATPFFDSSANSSFESP